MNFLWSHNLCALFFIWPIVCGHTDKKKRFREDVSRLKTLFFFLGSACTASFGDEMLLIQVKTESMLLLSLWGLAGSCNSCWLNSLSCKNETKTKKHTCNYNFTTDSTYFAPYFWWSLTVLYFPTAAASDTSRMVPFQSPLASITIDSIQSTYTNRPHLESYIDLHNRIAYGKVKSSVQMPRSIDLWRCHQHRTHRIRTQALLLIVVCHSNTILQI